MSIVGSVLPVMPWDEGGRESLIGDAVSIVAGVWGAAFVTTVSSLVACWFTGSVTVKVEPLPTSESMVMVP